MRCMPARLRKPGSISVEPKNTLGGAPAIAESLVFVADAIRPHIPEIATHQWRASFGAWAHGCLSDAVRAILNSPSDVAGVDVTVIRAARTLVDRSVYHL